MQHLWLVILLRIQVKMQDGMHCPVPVFLLVYRQPLEQLALTKEQCLYR